MQHRTPPTPKASPEKDEETTGEKRAGVESSLSMEPLVVDDSSSVVEEEVEHSVLVISHQAPAPSSARVNAALILGQSFFGLGSVIAALGLPACNPFAFALYREVTAGLLLLTAATAATTLRARRHPYIHHHPLIPLCQNPLRFLWLGLAIFANQAGGIVGIKLAGPIAAAVWQPSQPIMTAAICMAWKQEPFLGLRVVGVVVAFGACVLMVLLSSQEQRDDTKSDGDAAANNNDSYAAYAVGNLLFFVNCLGTSLYVILSKKVLQLYPPLTVTALSYNVAAVFMALAAFLFSTSAPLMHFICPECTSTWKIPPGAFFALAYFILFNSCAAYAIMTWANQHATGTLVMGFTVLQPVTAALFTVTLLATGVYSTCANGVTPCLDPPTLSSGLGMLGVFAGLYLVIVTEPVSERVHHHQAIVEDDDQEEEKEEDNFEIEPVAIS